MDKSLPYWLRALLILGLVIHFFGSLVILSVDWIKGLFRKALHEAPQQ